MPQPRRKNSIIVPNFFCEFDDDSFLVHNSLVETHVEIVPIDALSSLLKVYNWRATGHSSILKSTWSSVLPNSSDSVAIECNLIPIQHTLDKIQHVMFVEALQIIYACLEGFHSLFEKFGTLEVNENMVYKSKDIWNVWPCCNPYASSFVVIPSLSDATLIKKVISWVRLKVDRTSQIVSFFEKLASCINVFEALEQTANKLFEAKEDYHNYAQNTLPIRAINFTQSSGTNEKESLVDNKTQSSAVNSSTQSSAALEELPTSLQFENRELKKRNSISGEGLLKERKLNCQSNQRQARNSMPSNQAKKNSNQKLKKEKDTTKSALPLQFERSQSRNEAFKVVKTSRFEDNSKENIKIPQYDGTLRLTDMVMQLEDSLVTTPMDGESNSRLDYSSVIYSGVECPFTLQ